MTKFKFISTLPTTTRTRPASDLLTEFASALRARQGQWAVWPRKISRATAYTIASKVNKGSYSALPAPGYEAVTRNGVTYVRYIGAKEAA